MAPVHDAVVQVDSLASEPESWRVHLRAEPGWWIYSADGNHKASITSVAAEDDLGGLYVSQFDGSTGHGGHEELALRFMPRLDPLARTLTLTFAQAGERMLNRPEPMVDRALDVFRQISHEALSAGEGIKRIRRLFEPALPDRTLCQMPEIIEELRPVLDGLALRTNGMLSVHVPQPLPDILIDRTRIQHVLYALTDNAVDASGSLSSRPCIRRSRKSRLWCAHRRPECPRSSLPKSRPLPCPSSPPPVDPTPASGTKNSRGAPWLLS